MLLRTMVRIMVTTSYCYTAEVIAGRTALFCLSAAYPEHLRPMITMYFSCFLKMYNWHRITWSVWKIPISFWRV